MDFHRKCDAVRRAEFDLKLQCSPHLLFFRVLEQHTPTLLDRKSRNLLPHSLIPTVSVHNRYWIKMLIEGGTVVMLRAKINHIVLVYFTDSHLRKSLQIGTLSR